MESKGSVALGAIAAVGLGVFVEAGVGGAAVVVRRLFEDDF